MALLHLVRQSAFNSPDFEQCIDNMNSGDQLVLIDDGCYNLNHPLLTKAIHKLATSALFVVTTHCEARALTFSNDVQGITMEELAIKTFELDSVVTWQ